MARKTIDTMKIDRFRTLNLSAIGGRMIRARMSVIAVMDKHDAMSPFSYPRLAKKNGVIILKLISAT